MDQRETRWPTNEEVDRREREEGLASRTAPLAPAPQAGPVVPGPGVRPPVELGADGLGRDPLDREDPHAVPPATWRDELVVSGTLSLLVGVWLIASPAVLVYEEGDPAWHDAAAGVVVMILAAGWLAARPARGTLGWLSAAVGLWLFAAAFWLADSAAASWNEAISGAVVLILGAIAGSAARATRRPAVGARP